MAVSSQAQPPSDADIPVAPIAGSEFRGWTNAFVLRNSAMEIVVVPEVGRIVHMARKDGENLFRLDKALYGSAPDPESKKTWANVGGDWMWPVAQSHWKKMGDTEWPPPQALAERSWTGRAWKRADGAQSCLISREYGEPVNVKISRQITLDKSDAKVQVRQRIERTGESDIPVTLWNISQIGGAEQLVLPLDNDLAKKDGLKALMGNMPRKPKLTRCDESVVYDTSSGEYKIGSLSERAWIAARKGKLIVLESATYEEDNDAGSYPDGGCTVEMYSNTGMGYSEIETLSKERVLEPGESLQNVLTIVVIDLKESTEGCSTADEVRKALGEIEPDTEDYPVK